MLQAQGLVNAERNKKGIHRSHSRRFRRRERAGIDAAHDNDRQHQAPDGAFQRIHPFRPGRFRFQRQVTGFVNHHADEENRQHKAGNYTGHEQLADRLAGDGAVEDHGDGRRDQDAQGTAGRHCAQYHGPFIIPFQHFRNGNGADGNRTGRG